MEKIKSWEKLVNELVDDIKSDGIIGNDILIWISEFIAYNGDEIIAAFMIKYGRTNAENFEEIYNFFEVAVINKIEN